MTPAEFDAARIALGWSNVGMARSLECSEGTIRQMEAGRRRIPPSIAQWLTQLAAYHAAHPGAVGLAVFEKILTSA